MFDRARPFTMVGGRPPVAFVQDGIAYDAREQPLGPCSPDGTLKQAEPVSEPVVEEAPDADRTALEEEAAFLGVRFRSNISTDRLRERVEAAKHDAT